ncbi:MAG TPA: GAF domain-containing protein [Pyrinomonadaceae bacterium]
MPSRDLEQSLREDIEGYVESRLSGVREEFARLRDQFNQAFERLSERLSADAQSDAPVAVAIADHLRQARNAGIETAAEGSSRARSSSDVAIIKAAVEDIQGQQSQGEILNTLVNRAASFAPRVAFFVVKNERITGWRARGMEGTVGDDSVRELSMPLTSDTLLAEAARSRQSWSGAPGAHAEDNRLYGHFGGEPPARLIAVPLVVRDKTVAVLYADTAEQDADAVNLEALETLVRVSGMAVDLVAARRGGGSESGSAVAAAPQRERESESPAQPERVEEVSAEPSFTEAAATAPTVEAEPVETREPEPFVEAEPAPADDEEEARPEYVAEPDYEPAPAQQQQQQEGQAPDPWTGRGDIHSAPAFEPAATAPVAASPQAESSSMRRRAGADLPIEVSEEERPVHDRARRFARLLVSEIKLYNEQKVREGRDAGDIYGRLRDDIDRSREMYDKRFAEQVGGRYDYFHHELVSTLAEGDDAKLGSGYPGAAA